MANDSVKAFRNSDTTYGKRVMLQVRARIIANTIRKRLDTLPQGTQRLSLFFLACYKTCIIMSSTRASSDLLCVHSIEINVAI